MMIAKAKIANDPADISRPISPAAIYYYQQKDAVDIAKIEFVSNKTGKQCVWSSIETVGRKLGIRGLIDPPLTSYKECQGGADHQLVSEVLSRLDIKHAQALGKSDYNVQAMMQYVEKGIPIIIGTSTGSNSSTGHALVVTNISSRTVRIVDTSNFPNYEYEVSYDNFINMWDGWILVVLPD